MNYNLVTVLFLSFFKSYITQNPPGSMAKCSKLPNRLPRNDSLCLLCIYKIFICIFVKMMVISEPAGPKTRRTDIVFKKGGFVHHITLYIVQDITAVRGEELTAVSSTTAYFLKRKYVLQPVSFSACHLPHISRT